MDGWWGGLDVVCASEHLRTNISLERIFGKFCTFCGFGFAPNVSLLWVKRNYLERINIVVVITVKQIIVDEGSDSQSGGRDPKKPLQDD